MKKERNNQIIKLSIKKSQKEIAEIFGISQSRVADILKRNDAPKQKKSRLNMSKLKLDVNYFQNINSNEKAYWLGYICADGSINRNNNKLNLTSKDEEVIIKFKQDLMSEHKITNSSYFDKRTNKTYYRYTIQISNELFVKNLNNLGITNLKSDLLEFPNIDEKYYNYFIAGLFDGDGSLSIKNNKVRINLISTLEILIFIQEYLLNNFNIGKIKMQKVTKNKPNVWKLYLYKDALKFLDFIYQDNEFKYMKRKYDKYHEFKKIN